MRRRTTRIAGVMTAAIMAIGISVSTPVFAGTTLSDMATADAERIDAAFTGKTLGNNDVAFVVYNTLAEETGTYDATDGRKTYNATINYRIYFNDLSEEDDNHAVSIPALVYRVIPSGGGTNDDTKWPFPYMVDNYTQSKLRTMIKNNGLISDFLYYNGGDDGYFFSKTGNTPTMMDDLKEGIFSWKCYLDLQGEDGDRPYEVYETDGNGSYQHCYLTLNKIVGKPGDKIEVKIFQSYITNVSGSSTSLRQIPYDAVNRVDRATRNDGIVVESGYIYIPYKVTYDINGATGTTPTVTAGELFTCDHNTVTVPTQGDMVAPEDGAELLGWSATKTTGVIDASDAPDDMAAPGGTYEIPADKREDVKLYAVWGKNTPVNVYDITYDYNEGSAPVNPNPGTYTEDDIVNITNEPVRQGYEFTGWTGTNVDTPQKQVSFGPGETGDKTYKANWQAKTDTSYRVEYYYQMYGAYRTNPDSFREDVGVTDTYAGVTTNDKVPVKAGYVFDNAANNVLSGRIAPDGSLVLKVYFKQQFSVVYAPGEHGTWDVSAGTVKGLDYGADTPAISVDPDTQHDEGYTFKGWDKAIASNVTHDEEYEALWEINKYSVTFDNNGHASAPAEQTIEHGKKVTNPGELSEEGYSFGGWFADRECTDENKYDFNTPVKGDMVLYAKWTKEYKITYDYNGGSAPVNPNPGTYTEGASVNITNEPVRQGYEFTGWTGANGDTPQKQVSFGPGETGDKTYKANWQINPDASYKVEYYYQVDGGYRTNPDSFREDVGVTDTSAEVTSDDKVPVKAGYVFDNAANNVLSGTIAPDGSLVLKVYFKQQFSVVYAPGEHGTWNVSDGTVTGLDYNAATPSISEIGIDPETQHKEGYTFKGWDKAIESNVTHDEVYTPLWEINEYSVTFDTNGIGNAPGQQNIKHGDKVTAPGELKAEGYSFGGWFTDRECTDENKYDFNTPVKGDMVLYAKWTKDKKPVPEPTEYTICYDLNGGTYEGNSDNIIETYADGTQISIHDAPIRDGYTFLYWQGSEYQPGDLYTVTGNHTFTAQWKKNEIADVFNDKPTDNNSGKDTLTNVKKEDMTPKTGDENSISIYTIIGTASAAVITTVLVFEGIKKKKKKRS